MELSDFARRIVLSETIEEKLRPIDGAATDDSAGETLRVPVPGRPADLQFAPRRGAPSMPPFGRWSEPAQRGLVHHILANHELQAVEVMAWVLLAFPEAPPEFRRGLVDIIADEQRHTRMHIERAAMLGVRFGDYPVNRYIWGKAKSSPACSTISRACHWCWRGRTSTTRWSSLTPSPPPAMNGAPR